MKRILLFLAVLTLASVAAAQAPSVGPAAGTGGEPPRRDLWQLLSAEQREQLWRSLTPEQRGEIIRGLGSQERHEWRQRMGPPPEVGGERGPGRMPMTMTPEERQRMREQIREAHRLRRERMDAERGR